MSADAAPAVKIGAPSRIPKMAIFFISVPRALIELKSLRPLRTEAHYWL